MDCFGHSVTSNNIFQVSITRAKRQFFLVANSDTMKESKELNRLLEIITEHGTVIELSKKRTQKLQKR
jgi:superfamily I DNA and/or RNA helicase